MSTFVEINKVFAYTVQTWQPRSVCELRFAYKYDWNWTSLFGV